MKVTFWGVRGSVPAPGPETNRYGGNTSCVELRTKNNDLVIVDAGTGIIGLGRALMAQSDWRDGKGRAGLLLSHTHWDHIQGFPFFAPIFVPGNHFTIFGPGRSSSMLEGILEGQMNPNFSPLYTMRNLGATIEVSAADAPEQAKGFSHAGLQLRAVENPHGPSSALAYRVGEGNRAIVYASDVAYEGPGPSAAALALYQGADLLIHDCTFTPEDRQSRKERGFSSIEDAVKAALAGKVKGLVMFHYDQDYTDDFVDAMVTRTRRLLDEAGGKEIALIPAQEGQTLSV